jgi:SagB-type dehydrogenase family enzyme
LIHRYHDGTKHSFQRFARSLGYLDWASQPNPFRSFAGAPVTALAPRPDAPASPLGTVLRHALGLTAWKQHRQSRWSLRANPSSGNLHPTEAYVVTSADQHATVSHYAPDQHALELRCVFDAALPREVALVALTSIHWREAWKYGERAFRYCQHDLGHAIAAIRFAASLAGWTARLLPEWSHADIAALTGIDRDQDYVDAEREEAECLIVVSGKLHGESRGSQVASAASPAVCRESILDGVRRGQWSGRANQLSEDHVQWTFIDEIAEATRDPGRARRPDQPDPPYPPDQTARPDPLAAHILQRRSAVAFDGQSSIHVDRAVAMLAATMAEGAPFDALWWSARVHLALFVHRVDGLEPGLYLLMRQPESGARLKAALRRDFLYEPASDRVPLLRLARGDCRRLARRLSCDQDIAADGFFSLGMIAEFDRSLEDYGPSFYRQLFWESGVVGQVLYLEAEAAGVRATGIGCFYDDPVHDVLGLTGHAFQSLYHFTVGVPVEDTRLTTEPGYSWERLSAS